METALNIKNRRQRIEYLYDRACDIVDEYNNKNGIICHYSAEGITDAVLYVISKVPKAVQQKICHANCSIVIICAANMCL